MNSHDNTSYDENHFLNLGLSINSQELISQLYHSFNESDAYREKFEDILYSVFDDIQKYKNENDRLERAHKSEKEKNDEIMTNMIEEAERQLVLSTDRIKEEIKAEYEKTIEGLNIDHAQEIMVLSENLSKLQSLQKQHTENKLDEDSKIQDYKHQIAELTAEKRSMLEESRELTTQVSILRSEIAVLKASSNQKELDRLKCDVFNKETVDLKHEINILHETNKRLSHTNNVLLTEITNINAGKGNVYSNTVASTPAYSNKMSSKFFPNRPNYMSSDRVTDDDSLFTDEEIDSGNWTLNNSDLDETNRTIPVVKGKRAKDPMNSIVEISQPPKSNALPERIFKVCFVGDSAVGKTSYIMRYCMGEFYQSTSATLGVDFHIKNLDYEGKNVALQLWDTCGQERFRSIAVSYFRKADGAVLMYDCTSEQTFLNVREWIQSVNYMTDKPVSIILVANKTDLRDEMRNKGVRVVEYEQGLKLAKEFGSLFYETSTKTGKNVERSLIDLTGLMDANQLKEISESSSNNIKLGEDNAYSIKKKCC